METKRCSSCHKELPITEFYRRKNREVGYTSLCKSCGNINSNKWHRTKKGLINRIYNNQKRNCRERKCSMPDYSYEEFSNWVFENKTFHELYDIWIDSNYDRLLAPSCDRIDSHIGYSFNNLEVVTFKENQRRAYLDRKSGYDGVAKKVNKYDYDGNFIETYVSTVNAANSHQTHQTSISLACRRKTKSAVGYQWRFFDDCDDISKYENTMPNRGCSVLKFSKEKEFIHKYKSVKEASVKLGISTTSIYNNLHGQSNTSGGFIFIYEK